MRYPRYLAAIAALTILISQSVQSQELRRVEVERHGQRALREMTGNRTDELALERTKKAFGIGSNEPWDKTRAVHNLTALVHDGQIRLRRVDNTVRLEPIWEMEGSNPTDDSADKASSAGLIAGFVQTWSSIVRREAILDEIRSHPVQREFDRAGLQEYLQYILRLSNYKQVADSFSPNLNTKLVVLQEPATLLRLFGGEAQPIGHYFFCCLSKLGGVDGTGLALPPQNLRNQLAAVTLPAGTEILVGTVADNFKDASGRLMPGGNTQIFVPKVSAFQFDKFVFAPAKEGAEFVVYSEDRVLRFRRATQNE